MFFIQVYGLAVFNYQDKPGFIWFLVVKFKIKSDYCLVVVLVLVDYFDLSGLVFCFTLQ